MHAVGRAEIQDADVGAAIGNIQTPLSWPMLALRVAGAAGQSPAAHHGPPDDTEDKNKARRLVLLRPSSAIHARECRRRQSARAFSW